ncbi:MULTISPECIES: hypothetical protein [Catenuloplanes]|uniref:ABC-2 type transport system permease protein n=2 Tax=Catenuloplanes TaxID=33874 RepID=A0AAE4CAH3_9ACTN|nr:MULTISPECIES: hypothetical protein [Catenuloplanes]MDQ0366895.1 ABC-2 type transport system permease protein [Catenuloplanes indicus]MDR7277601.1 ABC-2 type transport system permease protein [Catenuloplanes atrovinosus]
MTAPALTLPARPGAAVTGLAVRQIRRGGAIVLLLAAGMPALVTATYDGLTADPAAAAGLTRIAANPAIRTLFGTPIALDHAGGFTVWRIGTVLTVILTVWATLTTTRVLRGEEEAGRWSLLLAGRSTPRAVFLQHLAVIAAVPVTAGIAVTAALWTAGPDLAGAIVHGAGVTAAGLFAVAVAALSAQIFPARAPATGTAIAVLGAGLLLRMIGDGLTALGWLHWLSPFGLLALSSPYGRDDPLPLLLLTAAALAIAAAALAAVGRRDLGGGLTAPAAGRAPRRWLLGGPAAFAVRRAIGPVLAWTAGIGAYFLLIGLTARSVTEFLTGNAVFADAAAQAGFAGMHTVEGFTASLFALLALPAGAFTAVRIGAFAAAETDRRLTPLAAAPLTRTRLLAAETAATTGGALILLTVAALATWAGVTAVGGGLTLPAALAGTFNTLPIVALSLGAAVLALGGAPRVTVLAGTLPATGGFLLQVLADATGAPTWVRELSPFPHLAPVPLTGVAWPAAVTMTSIAVALAVAGTLAYHRRDLRS